MNLRGSKFWLMLLSVILIIMGALGLFPGLDYDGFLWASEPIWHAILKIIIGLTGLIVALVVDKSEI